MQIYLGKRYYFNNESGLRMLEESVPKFDAFNSIRNYEQIPINLSLMISADEDKLSPEQVSRANDAMDLIRNRSIRIWYDSIGATAGQKFTYQIFKRPIPKDQSDVVVGLCCFDQYPLEREEHLDAIVALGEKLVKDKKLYACGSRNVPVELGVHKVPSDMRIVHELVQLLATRSDSFRAEKPEWANPSIHYAHFGELCSGLYLFNPAHSLYPIQKKEILERRADTFEVPGFAIDYFTAMHAGLNNAAASGYIYAVRNPFYSTITEQDERNRFSNFIKKQTSLVGKTSVRPALETMLDDYGELSRLNNFFDPLTVQETTELMREGLRTT